MTESPQAAVGIFGGTGLYSLLTGDTRQLNEGLSNVFENYYLTQSGGLTYRHVTRTYQASVGLAGQHAELYRDAQFPRP